jgi:hypothetical protein
MMLFTEQEIKETLQKQEFYPRIIPDGSRLEDAPNTALSLII